MPQYPIAPWFSQGADPAAHYQTGLQIGARIGAEQAAQQYQQQQLLREQQKDEFDKQYKTAVLQMQVDEVTQKHRAMSDYQSMIAQGVDPMTALRQVGPQMGVSPDKIEQIDALRGVRQQQHQYEQSRLGESIRHNLAAEQAATQRTRDAQARAQAIDARAKQRMRQSLVGIISRDSTLKQLQSELDSAQRLLRDLDAEKPGWFSRTTSEIAQEKARTKQDIADLQGRIKARQDELRGQVGEVATAAAPDTDMGPEESAGDNTMPDVASEPEPAQDWKTIEGFKVRAR